MIPLPLVPRCELEISRVPVGSNAGPVSSVPFGESRVWAAGRRERAD